MPRGSRIGRTAAAAVAVTAALGGVAAATLRGEPEPPRAIGVEPSIADWRWAPRASPAETAALPTPVRKARATEPRAGAPVRTPLTASPAAEAPDREADAVPGAEPVPEPTAPAAPQPDPDDALGRAEVLRNGIALPPLDAPPEVEAIIEAGNTIARHPYKWGGGHGRWQDDGYDCSGSVSFALAAAGLLGSSLNSSGLMTWGRPGKGRWVTVWTNPGHVFLEVAGVRFDTTGRRATGSRWQNRMRSTSGYVARHPPGL